MSVPQLFLITNHTNLHVGAGNSNQGVIDNMVQRDHVDVLPGIHSSSLKGALREFFVNGPGKTSLRNKAEDIFGSEASSGNLLKGNYIFHDGILLSYPVRSYQESFFYASAPMIFERLFQNIDLFDLPVTDLLIGKLKEIKDMKVANGQPKIFNYPVQNNFRIEEFEMLAANSIKDISAEFKIIETLFGDKLVLFSDEDFKTITDDYNLPVIARNQLENGVSKNLFYEQVVPREARFYFFVSNYSSTNDLSECIDTKKIQLGANGTIGYGLCSFKFLNNLLNPAKA